MSGHTDILGLVVAAIGGAAVGVERQRSHHRAEGHAVFGGIRTFTLLGGVSGLAGWIATLHMMGAALILLGGAVALVAGGYVTAARRQLDATTETAALVVIAAGFAAGLGWLALSSAVIATTTLLLVEKSRLHALVGRIDDEELQAAARFGVMAVVILPLLPAGPFGPIGGVRPRELWLLVLFFTALNFVGYLAQRALGAARGYPVAGLLMGMVSSTSATLTFARTSRSEPGLSRPLAMGVVGACSMLFPRVLLATMVVDMDVASALLPYLAAPFAIGAIPLAIWWRRNALASQPAGLPNPLQLGPALGMAAVFQLVLLGVFAVRRAFGAIGLLASGAVLGLTDVDALTISMAKSASAGVTPHLAAQAIAIGVLANCVLKTGIAIVSGATPFRRLAAPVIAAMAAAMALTLGMAG